MRFLHTADWQIGMKAVHVGSVAEKVREQRLTTAARVMQLANDQNVDFVLVAGDTFEDNGVDRVLVQRVADILAQARSKVFVLPGNHDPLTPGSVWQHPVWESVAQRVSVVRSRDPIPLPGGGSLFPAPLTEKYSSQNPTASIAAQDSTEIAIGLAHGTVQGIQQETLDYPIPRDAPQRCGLDYLAIGHWHSFSSFPASDGSVRLAYSGTHETTKFGERESGQALLVEIAARHVSPQITPHPTGALNWKVLEKTVHSAAEVRRLAEELEQWQNPAQTLIDLRLGGVLQYDMPPELKRIEELLAARFLYARCDSSMLLPSPQDDRWLDELPAGVLRATAKNLQRWSESSANLPAGVTTSVAQRALLELFRYWRESNV